MIGASFSFTIPHLVVLVIVFILIIVVAKRFIG